MHTNLRVCPNLKPARTQMAFAPKCEYRCGVVHSNLSLFSIVTDTHADMVVAIETERQKSFLSSCTPSSRITHHQILKGSSKRVIRIPLSSLRARSPNACLPTRDCHIFYGGKHGKLTLI